MDLNKYLVREGSGKRALNFKGKDETGKFWVVTYPTENSELADIVFDADVFDFHLQIAGGLTGDEIEGLYNNKAKAMKVAKKLLEDR